MIKFSLKLDTAFDLDTTLDCGQTFRWEKTDGWWKGVVRDTVLFLKQSGKKLDVIASRDTLLGMDIDEGLRKYLGFEDDLEEVHSTLEMIIRSLPERTKELSLNAVKQARGLRILRQDPLEMTVEYIISTRNSIPTIRKISDLLSAKFPENRVEMDDEVFYTFPSLEQLKHLKLEDLLEIKLGFRADWLYELFQNLEDEMFFEELYDKPLMEKLEELMKIKGIGYKVGSCITLFAYAELNSFPVDVWIKRVMKDLFGVNGSTKKVMEFGMETFAPYAGYYQEAVFRYYRTHKLGRDKQ